MSANSLSVPFPIFNDIDGDPLDAGYIYVGTASLDPETNPIETYFDAELTIPATQPIRTLNGYPSNNGSPTRLYVNASDYSITVRNKNGSFIYSSLNVTERIPVTAETIIYNEGSAGAVDRSLESRLQDRVSLDDFGPSADGVTNDQTHLDNAIASGARSINVNDDSAIRYLVTSLSNQYGIEIYGASAIVKAITGGVQKLNSYVDKDQYVFGREYMAAFHNLLISEHTSPTRQPVVIFSGDSTTAGDSASADYHLEALMKRHGNMAGIQTPYGLNTINAGHSGAYTQQWIDNGWLAADLASSPDLYVLRWGINDPGWLQDGTAPPLDAGQDYPNRRTPEDFIASLRSGLATIRASRDVTSLSILLMTPNATSDTPNGRDELYYEKITPMIKQAARDFQCTFIDTYALFKDTRTYAAGAWMDDPFGDGRAIHPYNVMNTWITDVIADVVFPTGLANKIGRNKVQNIGGAEDVGDVTRAPSYYDYGITISRALTSWPVDGQVITIRSQDETVLQIVYPYKVADAGLIYFRTGRAITLGSEPAGWDSWTTVGASVPFATRVDVTGSRALGTTYTNTTGRAMMVMYSDNGGAPIVTGIVDGVQIIACVDSSATNMAITFVVPPGSTYQITGGAIWSWNECY